MTQHFDNIDQQYRGLQVHTRIGGAPNDLQVLGYTVYGPGGKIWIDGATNADRFASRAEASASVWKVACRTIDKFLKEKGYEDGASVTS